MKMNMNMKIRNATMLIRSGILFTTVPMKFHKNLLLLSPSTQESRHFTVSVYKNRILIVPVLSYRTLVVPAFENHILTFHMTEREENF